MSAFVWIGNHAGLDFLNTAAADDRGEAVELLDAFEVLTSWLHEAGLVSPSVLRQVRADDREELLAWARRLRAAGRAVLDPEAKRTTAEPGLDAIVAEVPIRLTYCDTSRDLPPVDAVKPVDRVRLALALAVLDATRLDPERVRRCNRAGCVLLFYDTSKNGTRRWCDMAVCGNRAKAAAHYQRWRAPSRSSPIVHGRSGRR
jgi:predicted RNA-binding Zn ribbon-like protein